MGLIILMIFFVAVSVGLTILGFKLDEDSWYDDHSWMSVCGIAFGVCAFIALLAISGVSIHRSVYNSAEKEVAMLRIEELKVEGVNLKKAYTDYPLNGDFTYTSYSSFVQSVNGYNAKVKDFVADSKIQTAKASNGFISSLNYKFYADYDYVTEVNNLLTYCIDLTK